ncbi:hypothetical protein O1611_g8391 [Lasiodiplodia mahajangana]|uniref:Uncharacterized protein n=1 Tax=Lasiodiplodia mahajangana TaxID=1108764 RepID=A0ACC2JDF4_9PEZI|nr:hypothetical protein O1611_g8391 [Lasiodiplodia mahajangana]
MAPTLLGRALDLNGPSAAFRSTWSSPSNYAFTILLLVGGDVVSMALAQLAGGRITPVAFSFGWVSYATNAINSAVGENKLMRPADTPCTVINADNNQSRGNGSWVLGRVIRDFEYWMGQTVRDKVGEVKKSKYQYDRDQAEKHGKDPGAVEYPAHAGLVVSFWKFDPEKKDRLQKPGRDLLFWSGIAITILQLGIAAIPFGVNGNWGIFLVTAAGIILCFITGFWKQWGREKTRGNGAQHAIVIEGDGFGLNLEDLCTGFDNLDEPAIPVSTRFAMIILGVLWVALLITSSALTDQSWYLIAVGLIGMLQNIFVAAWSRTPDAFGLPLKFQGVIGSPKVFTAILESERAYPKVGRALAGPFFPGGIYPKEEEQLAAIEAEAKEKKNAEKATTGNLEAKA